MTEQYRQANNHNGAHEVSNTLPQQAETLIENIPALERIGSQVRSRVRETIFSGGEQGRDIADVLHGVWLGHPLHSVLTDMTVTSLTLAAVSDMLALVTRSRYLGASSDILTMIGTGSAIPTAISGMTDYSAIKKDSISHGMLHGMLNSAALLLYGMSLRSRLTRRRGRGVTLSTIGFGLMMTSAWLGGELVYRRRVGVNHGRIDPGARDWTPVMAAEDLNDDGSPQRVDLDGHPIMLFHHGGELHAMDAVCSHAGGPLDEGDFENGCVTCPWHQSVFDLDNGHVVHGPATYSQHYYGVRIQDGEVYVKALTSQ